MESDTLNQLRKLGDLIQSSINTLLETTEESNIGIPSKPVFDLQRILLSAAGKLTELVSQPSNRILELSTEYFESRCLHIVADKRVPDILAEGGPAGVHIKVLAKRVRIESRKLCRILRCLCSLHIFEEITTDTFANNRISAALVNNEPLRAYVVLFATDPYTCSDYLPRNLNDPIFGPSYDVTHTAFQVAVNTTKPRWEWLEEKITVQNLRAGNFGSNRAPCPYPGPFGAELEEALNQKADDAEIARPEYTNFGLAMVGGGRVSGQAHLYDFPWSSLGAATIVDVGGGVGGFCLQLSHLYPDLDFIVQDRAPAVAQAENHVWPKENPAALKDGRVSFMPIDFFEVNPVKNADVYWLRYILHDWSDDYCVRILSALKPSMGPNSRILICDQVMNTTLGSSELAQAPAPLPANWGYYTRYSHQRDIAMMATLNGIERTPAEFRTIVERANLKIRKFWDCRSQVSLIEIVLPSSELPE